MQVKFVCSEKESLDWISGFQWWRQYIYTNNSAIFIMIFAVKTKGLKIHLLYCQNNTKSRF